MLRRPENYRERAEIALGICLTCALLIKHFDSPLPHIFYIVAAIWMIVAVKVVYYLTDSAWYCDSNVLANAITSNLLPKASEGCSNPRKFYLYNEDKEFVIHRLKVYTYEISKRFTASYGVAETSKGTGWIDLEGNVFTKETIHKQIASFVEGDFELEVIDLHQNTEIVDTAFEKNVKKELRRRNNYILHDIVETLTCLVLLPLSLIAVCIFIWLGVLQIKAGLPMEQALFYAIILILFLGLLLPRSRLF